MHGPRYFVEGSIEAGTVIALAADDARHAAAVLRSKSGDPLTLLAAGVAWDAEISAVARDIVEVRALRKAAEQSGELPVAVVVLQGLTKGAKFDEVVEKTIELGAARIVPVIFARSEAEGGPNKIDRWRRIARTAAMQSRRRIVPAVEAPLTWCDALARYAPGALTLVAFEEAPAGTFARALDAYRDGAVVIAVGPEGGLQRQEIESARLHGAHIVSLGPTILRTQTAATALLAAVASAAGWW